MSNVQENAMLAGRRFSLGVLFWPALAWAGDIKGKVTAQGMRSAENIAVYVDAIPGKEFPAPAQHVTDGPERI